MTKKEFKERCTDQTYTGWNGHRIRINAFFFDWKSGETADGKYFGGYKYMVSTNVKNLSKVELFNYLYLWVTEQIANLPWYINYQYAENDTNRFKIPLSL
jgi:hypothetical protein